jgi:hypothetical protein
MLSPQMFKQTLWIIILLSSSAAFAQEVITLNCSGVLKGNTIRDSPKNFEIQVRTNPPDISGRVGDMSWCIGDENKIKEPPCKTTDQEITCSCSGGNTIISSTVRLSRYTAIYNVVAILKDDVWQGTYQCRKLERKLF